MTVTAATVSMQSEKGEGALREGFVTVVSSAPFPSAHAHPPSAVTSSGRSPAAARICLPISV